MDRTYIVSATFSMVASTAKTLILLNPTNALTLSEVDASFDSNAVQPAALVELYRTTTLGSPAGTSFTPVKGSTPADQAASVTALVNLTAEPTAVEILRHWWVQPFGGRLGPLQFPLGRELVAAGSSVNRLGLRVTAGASSTPSCKAYMEFVE